MEDKIIELTKFNNINEAEVLASLLKSENIDCFVRDRISSLAVMDIKIDVPKKYALRALRIMEDHGYDISESLLKSLISENPEDVYSDDYSERENDESYSQDISITRDSAEIEDDNVIYENDKSDLSRNMIIIIFFLFLIFGVLIMLNRYYNG